MHEADRADSCRTFNRGSCRDSIDTPSRQSCSTESFNAGVKFIRCHRDMLCPNRVDDAELFARILQD